MRLAVFLCYFKTSRQAFFTTKPFLMQLVHARMCRGVPFTMAFTLCRFGSQRLLVRLCA